MRRRERITNLQADDCVFAENQETLEARQTASLLARTTGIRTWMVSGDGQVTFAPSSKEMFWLQALHDSNDLERLLQWGQTHDNPTIAQNTLGLAWAILPNGQDGIVLMGPVTTSQTRMADYSKTLSSSGLDDDLVVTLLRSWDRVPVISITMLMTYAALEYGALRQTHVSLSDFTMMTAIEDESTDANEPSTAPNSFEHERSWDFERMLMRVIETGDINYTRTMQHTEGLAPSIGRLSIGDPLRQAKNAIIVHTAICCRAALRAGCPEETAYGMSDRFIQQIERAGNVIDVYAISRRMFDDYVRTMHDMLMDKNDDISQFTARCLGFLRMHEMERYSLSDLARDMGYTEYYLSRRFKEETGQRLTDRMREMKIDAACALLERTSRTVTSISSTLGFKTPSHFASVFKSIKGTSPLQWRKRTQNTQLV